MVLDGAVGKGVGSSAVHPARSTARPPAAATTDSGAMRGIPAILPTAAPRSRTSGRLRGMSFTRADLDAATSVVRRHFPATPQLEWPLLSEHVGAQVWVKHENATPTGAFKVRGGLVYADRASRERPDVKGFVSATRGNHGQSLAYAGRAAGLRVVIVVPEGNSPDKNAAMRGFGAELVVHGRDYQEAREHAMGLEAELGLEAVPPFHPDLVVGVGTYALELFDEAGPLDTVYVPVGMGSGICGLIGVRDAARAVDRGRGRRLGGRAGHRAVLPRPAPW